MPASRPSRRSCGPSVPLGEHGLVDQAVDGRGDAHGPRGRLRSGIIWRTEDGAQPVVGSAPVVTLVAAEALIRRAVR
jgi:hypothetical protein